MSVYALDFGTTSKGQPTHLYRMKNERGMEVDVCDLGASIVAIRVPDAQGNLVDVALGFDEADRYEHNDMAIGGTVGRCANRIGGAAFTLDGKAHQLTANDGGNALHGGRDMWFERLWEGATIGKKGSRRKGASADTVTFGLFSPDGDQGFPGDLDVRVTYRLSDSNELDIIYDAQPSVKTVVSLTNHTYWNLNGHDSGDVLGHTLQVAAERYTPAGPSKLPDGRKVNVGGTPFDFRLAKPIGQDFTDRFDNYDHNLLLGGSGKVQHAATLVGDKTSITLKLFTDLPALQVYTAKEMQVEGAKDGATYRPYAGVALEAQYTPDAIHHETFRQPVFTPDEPFQSRTRFSFSL